VLIRNANVRRLIKIKLMFVRWPIQTPLLRSLKAKE